MADPLCDAPHPHIDGLACIKPAQHVDHGDDHVACLGYHEEDDEYEFTSWPVPGVAAPAVQGEGDGAVREGPFCEAHWSWDCYSDNERTCAYEDCTHWAEPDSPFCYSCGELPANKEGGTTDGP